MKHQYIISCDSAEHILYKIKDIKHNTSFLNSREVVFANGEIKHVIHDDIKDKKVILYQVMYSPESNLTVNDNLMSLLTMIDSLIINGVKEIVLILPIFPYSRQDRFIQGEGVTSKLVASFLDKSIISNIITFEIHSSKVLEYFSYTNIYNIPMTMFFGKKLLSNIIDGIDDSKKYIVVGPDKGAFNRAKNLSLLLNCDAIYLDKFRDTNSPNLINSVNTKQLSDINKNLIIIDDIIDTGGTLIKILEHINSGKFKRKIFIIVGVCYFSNNSFTRFNKAFENKLFHRLITTNIIKHDIKSKWYLAQDINETLYHTCAKKLPN